MAQPALPDERKALIRQMLLAGKKASQIAAEIGHDWRTCKKIEREMIEAGFEALSGKPADPAAERRSERDAEFYRREARDLKRQLSLAEHLVDELSGLTGMDVTPADWLMEASQQKHRSVVWLVTSDHHAGEVVRPEEIDGANAYNPNIYAARYRRLVAASVEVGKRCTSDCHNVGMVYVRAGDTISGDIHQELKETNALTAHEQVHLVVAEECAGILKLADAFGAVHVVSVPGNHGRTTIKPVAKRYADTNYDTMIAKMIADKLDGDPRITFQTPVSGDAVVPVLGWQVLVTHGDRIGSRGGQGFIGPIATILRGAKKLRDQQALQRRPVDYIVHGHFHTTANPGRTISNGSLVGYGEYAQSFRAEPETPQQWLFVMHERWGIRERVPIQLEDPIPVPRPRVTVPAVMRKSA